MKNILFTSVCRPLGEAYGDAPSVGYELLHGQVTRAQGMFSPRSLHTQFSLEYIAANLDAPTVVLQYPSREELIRELKKGYDFVGIAFILATFHIMEKMVELVRRYSPKSQIILGSHGTVRDDEVLASYGDHVWREEWQAALLAHVHLHERHLHAHDVHGPHGRVAPALRPHGVRLGNQ